MRRAAFVIGFAIIASQAQAIDISGAGATFPYPVYARWASDYRQVSGDTINYQSIGSGGGIRQIKNRTVVFGASDMPLPASELESDALVQFPTVIGGVVPIVNIPSVKSGSITLDGPTLAKIYLGELTNWRQVRSDLPNIAIIVVRRSDGSGTTFLFTHYLSKVYAPWKDRVSANTSVEWPVGLGAKGNEGVANNVRQLIGSIGYVEYAYAKQTGATYVHMINAAGQAVAPTAESFAAAAEGANWAGTPGFGVILTDQGGARSWPIAGATFILMPKVPPNAAQAKAALDFFNWAYERGGAAAESLDYVALPKNVIAAIRAMWQTQIKRSDGQPLLQ